MMSSTSLQSTFAILKIKKKIKKRKGTLFSVRLQKKCMFTVSKEMGLKTHEQNTMSAFNIQSSYHTFQV